MKVLNAIPADKLEFTPGNKARTMGRVAFQIASQPLFISAVITKGAPDWGDYGEAVEPSLDHILAEAEKNFSQLRRDLAAISDDAWENDAAALISPTAKWETKKYDMAWGFLFDAIHHRGQLTTYLRILGEKVPAVYGNSGDETPTAQ